MDKRETTAINQALQNTGAMGNVALDGIIALCEELRALGVLPMDGVDRMEKVMAASAGHSAAEPLVRQKLQHAIQQSFRLAKGQG